MRIAQLLKLMITINPLNMKNPKSKRNLSKKVSLELMIKEFKEIVLYDVKLNSDSSNIAEKGGKILQKFFKANKAQRKEFEDEINEIGAKYAAAMSLQTNYHMIDSIDKNLRSMGIEMAKDLTKQYEIKTVQDKAYLQLAINAFCRFLSNSMQFETWKKHEFNSHERVSYMSMLSKDTDKAMRQFHSIIQYFEAKEQPSLTVNIKTKNAFVAQNQQNIANNSKQHEINDKQ